VVPAATGGTVVLEAVLAATGGAVVNAMLDPSLLVRVVVVEPFGLVAIAGFVALRDTGAEPWVDPEALDAGTDCSTKINSKIAGVSVAAMPPA
jgi:hypothetical protein